MDCLLWLDPILIIKNKLIAHKSKMSRPIRMKKKIISAEREEGPAGELY
jgi:hypothetical protein